MDLYARYIDGLNFDLANEFINQLGSGFVLMTDWGLQGKLLLDKDIVDWLFRDTRSESFDKEVITLLELGSYRVVTDS